MLYILEGGSFLRETTSIWLRVCANECVEEFPSGIKHQLIGLQMSNTLGQLNGSVMSAKQDLNRSTYGLNVVHEIENVQDNIKNPYHLRNKKSKT